jgi:hypothetical protein
VTRAGVVRDKGVLILLPFEGENNLMIQASRFLAICTIGAAFATSSIAWGQSYTTVDFPGAIFTALDGGPNPEGTTVGTYTDTSTVFHGFALKNGIFTSFDPPGSLVTVPFWISPQGVIVGQYEGSSGRSRFHTGWGTIHNG